MALSARQSSRVWLAVDAKRAERGVRQKQLSLTLGDSRKFRSERRRQNVEIRQLSHLLWFELRCLQAQNVLAMILALQLGFGARFRVVAERAGIAARALSCERELGAAQFVESVGVVAPVEVAVFAAKVKRRTELGFVEISFCAKDELGGVLMKKRRRRRSGGFDCCCCCCGGDADRTGVLLILVSAFGVHVLRPDCLQHRRRSQRFVLRRFSVFVIIVVDEFDWDLNLRSQNFT